MSAPQNTPQLPVPPQQSPRNKKTDSLIAVLVSIIIGVFAGILHRTMEGVSYYEAMKTAGGTTVSTDVATTIGAVPVSSADDELLRVLGLVFVLIATLWFAAIAADRYERGTRTPA